MTPTLKEKLESQYKTVTGAAPAEHTLYWIYGWDKDENNYNFDTSKSLTEAKKLMETMLSDGFHHAYIFWGNEDSAFTDLDYVAKKPLSW